MNDEFIPIHMDDAEAVKVGQKAAFGMGNLRVAYLHDALDDVARRRRATIVEVAAQFRGLNFKGDTLTTSGSVTGVERGADGGTGSCTSTMAVTNQDGVDTTPGTATVVLWGDGRPGRARRAAAGRAVGRGGARACTSPRPRST